MPTKDIIASLSQLGNYILNFEPDLEEIIERTYHHNKWFTQNNTKNSLIAISENYLNKARLNEWADNYSISGIVKAEKVIGIVAAGNIPLVGFHDLLSALITGNKVKIKLSDKDKILLPFLVRKLGEINQELASKVDFVERLKDFDAVIATGSNNTARYFEYYFGKYPSIIRKNRNSVAILTGNENANKLQSLGNDVFQYFGLGCRSVSKLFIPKGYDFMPLIETFEAFREVDEHYHYKNNLDYNRTLLLMNQVPFLDVDYVNIVENEGFASPISNLHYQYYSDINEVKTTVEENRNKIQCIVGQIDNLTIVDFGKAQKPNLMDYADNVDTIKFLMEL